MPRSIATFVLGVMLSSLTGSGFAQDAKKEADRASAEFC